MKKILLVLPTYNEEFILERNTLKLLEFCKKELIDYNWQILIADNGSTDNTVKIAKDLNQKLDKVSYFHIKKKGRGGVLKIAWQKYEADIYTYMDVDLATDLSYFLKLIEPIIKKENDLTIGSRLQEKSETERSFLREFISQIYNFLLKLFFNLDIKDYQCGFKAISKDLAKKIISKIKNDNWFFDTELIILSHQAGYKIKEFPVKWIEKRDKKRKSKVKVLNTILEDLKGIIRLKFK